MGGIPTHGPITTSRVKCLNFLKNFTHKIITLWLKYNSKQSHWMHGMLANKNAWYGQHNQLWDCNVKLSQCQYCHHWSSQKNKNMTRDFRMKTSCTTLIHTQHTYHTHSKSVKTGDNWNMQAPLAPFHKLVQRRRLTYSNVFSLNCLWKCASDKSIMLLL